MGWPLSFYESTIVNILYETFYYEPRKEIIMKEIFPGLLYLFLFITFAYYALRKESTLLHRAEWEADLILHKLTGVITVMLGIYRINRERKRKLVLFLVEGGAVLTLIMTLLLLINPSWLFDIGPRFTCALLVGFSAMTYVRHLLAFDYTSTQVFLFLISVKEATPFLILSVVCITLIAVAIPFVNADRKASQSIMVEPTGLPFLDAWFMQF